nr:hypothetical protein Iba_chr04bCG14280 [Ipomoea batatas]
MCGRRRGGGRAVHAVVREKRQWQRSGDGGVRSAQTIRWRWFPAELFTATRNDGGVRSAISGDCGSGGNSRRSSSRWRLWRQIWERMRV